MKDEGLKFREKDFVSRLATWPFRKCPSLYNLLQVPSSAHHIAN